MNMINQVRSTTLMMMMKK